VLADREKRLRAELKEAGDFIESIRVIAEEWHRERDEARAEVERLTRERDCLRNDWADAADAAATANATVDELRAKLAKGGGE